jgi:hypothetical protein
VTANVTAEEKHALEQARHLAENGVPLFVAKPAIERGQWAPSGGHNGCGYWLPPKWEQAEPDPAVVDRWKPGMALCAVMGHLVDAVDIDPRNGGDRAALNGTMPKSYGQQATPSGGSHFLIASLGVRKCEVLPGIDLQAGAEGHGHGFIFLAPTLRRSKVTGELAAYEWVEDPSLDGLSLIGTDPTGAALAELARSRRGTGTYEGPSYDGDEYAALAEWQQAEADHHVDRIVTTWRDRLAEAAQWDEGERDEHGRGWEALSYQFAWALAMLAACPWTKLDDGEAEELFHDTLPEEFHAADYCSEKWNDRLIEKAAKRPVEPPPWDGLDAVGEDGDADSDAEEGDNAGSSSGGGRGGRQPSQVVRMVDHIRGRYDVFPAGDDGRVFAQPKSGGRAELVTGQFVLRATRALRLRSSSLTAAATEAAKQIAWDAEDKPERRMALRVHYRPGRIVLDLAQPGSGRCVVVTPEGWTVQTSPPPDVVFHASGRALPTPEKGGSIEELRELLGWAKDDGRWPLVKGWLPAALLAGRPRPMLGFFGEKGSGKTTTGWFVASVLDPKPADPMTLGSGFGKQRSDDETKALKSYLPSWDNVSKLSDEGADFLSRLVTGDNIERRKLYSDSDVVTLTYRRTGVITGVTVPRGLKTDTQDRLIMFHMRAPEAGERVTEEALLARWEQAHPRVLAGVLDLAVRMLAGMAEAPNDAGKRMADYAAALRAMGEELYDAYVSNHDDAEADMAAEDPFVQTIRDWLHAEGSQYVEGTAEDIRKEASAYMVAPTEQWWPPNAKAFMDEVTRCAGLLRALGIEVTERKSNGKRMKRFSRTDTEDLPDPRDLI